MSTDESGSVTPLQELTNANTARIGQLNRLGVAINGANEALITRMLEALLGPVQTDRVNTEHQEWLSGILDVYEAQVLAQTPYGTMEALIASKEIGNRLQLPGRN